MESNAHAVQCSASSHTYYTDTHTHTHREDIADEAWVNTLHHSVGGYTGTSPSHPSSSVSPYPAPPSNPPRNLSLQLDRLPTPTCFLLSHSLSFLQSWIFVSWITPSPSSLCLLPSIVLLFSQLVFHPPHLAKWSFLSDVVLWRLLHPIACATLWLCTCLTHEHVCM